MPIASTFFTYMLIFVVVGRMWCHCRMVYLPMSYIYGKRFTGKITELVKALREELFVQKYSEINWDHARNQCAKVHFHQFPMAIDRSSMFLWIQEIVEFSCCCDHVIDRIAGLMIYNPNLHSPQCTYNIFICRKISTTLTHGYKTCCGEHCIRWLSQSWLHGLAPSSGKKRWLIRWSISTTRMRIPATYVLVLWIRSVCSYYFLIILI